MTVTTKWKLQWWSGSKNSRQNFTRQGYMFLFEGGTLLLREKVTMLKSSDMIRREPPSFSYMIHVPLSVIVPVLKKKMLLFDSLKTRDLICVLPPTVRWPCVKYAPVRDWMYISSTVSGKMWQKPIINPSKAGLNSYFSFS